ncbi:aminopeptidase P family protein [Aminipila butyrica]|uniref:Aminopeptidase P family protein n=1 Tax=Aminipila butyrica TaxID=433296 RepID=A0A858BZK3_9FIRM|nr:aminopeptidase P family protein [Aminipila butyrica]QIB69526.1 aminopeptidase P family protein [Aminipila butyrica]
MEERIKERSGRAVAQFEKYGIQALLLTKAADIQYMTGIPGEDCLVLLTADKRYIITDFRYEEAVSVLRPDFEIIIAKPGYGWLDFLREVNPETLGVQEEHLTLSTYNQLCRVLPMEHIISAGGLTESLRLIKDEQEIWQIKQAEAIGDKAFEHILGFLRPGLSEKQVALELEHQMKLNGADGFSFSTIAVSGVNSSKPHGIPSEKLLEDGDFLTMDFGCVYGGYCSDMTRTVAIGHASEEMVKVYNTVLEAQLYACANLKAGLHVKEGDALARKIIRDAGFGDCFGHGLGHGVGLEIHEDPFLSFRGSHVLEENMIVSIEPGIYLPGQFGVRIEDLAVITSEGIQNLTHSPKELIIIK